jgi:uncharacterized SAM-binding protein YcdF (DUF218 family)
MDSLIARLANPFALTSALLVVVLAELWWRRKLDRRRLAVLSVLVLGLAAGSTPAAAYFAVGSLEWRYPYSPAPAPPGEVVVVLGGELSPPTAYYPEPQLGPSTTFRCLAAARLYHQGGPCTIVLSGGPIPGHPDLTVADEMRDFMLTQGIPKGDLVVETQSRTTHENAREVRRLLRSAGARKIVLVTDAIHLLRAERCFAAQGFEVTPRGCRYRAQMDWSIAAIIPSPKAAVAVAEAAHEWIGLLWYWIRGWL